MIPHFGGVKFRTGRSAGKGCAPSSSLHRKLPLQGASAALIHLIHLPIYGISSRVVFVGTARLEAHGRGLKG